MTSGFQQQSHVNFTMPKSAASPQQVGKKLDLKAPPTPPAEPKSFK